MGMPDVPSSARPDGDTSSSDGTTTYLDAMSFPDGPAPAPASVAAAAAAAATGETPRRGSRARVSWVGDAAATGPVAAAWSPVGTDGTGGDPEFSLEPDLAADGLDEAEDGGGTPSSAKVFGVKPPWGWDYVFSFPLEDSLLAPPGARAAAAGATAADAPPVGDAPARPSGDTVDDADASGGSSKASRKAAKAVAHRVRILARLRSAGFVFSQLAVPSEGRVLVRFGLDEAGLKRKAALLGLKLRLQDDFGGGYLDYEPERDAAFVNALRSGCYFAPSDRILIILSTLASKAVWGCDINVEAEVFSGHICQAFAIHDRGPRDQLVRDVVWDRLWDVRWTPPLSALRDYVGARVCMYFTFLSFYTQMLLYIGVVSLPIYIASKLTSSAVVVAALRFVFAIALVLWTTVFLERWKRRNAGVQLEWGLSDFADDTADDVRPQFLGEIRPGFYCKGGFVPLDDVAEQKAADLEAGTPSRTTTLRRRAVSTLSTSAAVDVVDGEPDGGGAGGGSPASAVTPTTDDDDGELVADDLPYQPWVRSNRFRKAVLVSVSATIFFTSLVATASFLLLLYKREVANGIGKFGNSTAAHYLPGVLQGIMITILDPIWRSISLWLTQMENHRTNQAYEDALVIKRFSFMFVSNYVSLFYIAFVRPWVGDGEESCAVSSVTGLPDCTVELEAQLLSMIITKTTVQQALEILLPWLMTFVQHQLGRWRAYRARRKSASAAAAGDVEEGAANPTSRFSRYVRESMLPPFSTTIEDYAEMVVQVGYLSLFGVAFPLVTFVALLNNLIEVRSDAFKILRLHQRVNSDQSGDIGAWLSILEFIKCRPHGRVSEAYFPTTSPAPVEARVPSWTPAAASPTPPFPPLPRGRGGDVTRAATTPLHVVVIAAGDKRPRPASACVSATQTRAGRTPRLAVARPLRWCGHPARGAARRHAPRLRWSSHAERPDGRGVGGGAATAASRRQCGGGGGGGGDGGGGSRAPRRGGWYRGRARPPLPLPWLRWFFLPQPRVDAGRRRREQLVTQALATPAGQNLR